MNNFCVQCGRKLNDGETCNCKATGQTPQQAPPNASPQQNNIPNQAPQYQHPQGGQPQAGQPVNIGQQPHYRTDSQGAVAAKSSIKDLSAFFKTLIENPVEAFRNLKESNNFVLAIICIVIKAIICQGVFSVFTALHYVTKYDWAYVSSSQKFQIFGGNFLMNLLVDFAVIGVIFLVAKMFNSKVSFTQVLSTFGVIALFIAVFYVLINVLAIPLGNIRFIMFITSIFSGVRSGIYAVLFFFGLSAIFDKKDKNFFLATAISMCAVYVVTNIVTFIF